MRQDIRSVAGVMKAYEWLLQKASYQVPSLPEGKRERPADADKHADNLSLAASVLDAEFLHLKALATVAEVYAKPA